MKKMKKIRFACLALAALMICTGCGKEDGKTDTEDTEGESVGVTEETNGTDTKQSDTQETDAKQPLPPSGTLQFDNTKNGIYNYCPSIMQMSDGSLYVYYCTNTKSYEVVDYIGCRRGERQADGSVSWGEEMIVLSPTLGAWDGHHVCDPSVIAGEFSYGGESYGYLLAYLGCTSYDNQDNKIGLAVSKTPEGPFVKVGDKPFIDFTMDSSTTVFQWGVGQPSLINIDKKGSVYLFYTRGDKDGTRLMVDEWELSDLDAPKKQSTVRVSTNGLTNLNGNTDNMNNADLVYDAEGRRFYASSDCHPNPSSTPNFISSHFRVTSFSELYGISGAYWKTEATVSPTDTGYARNHNTGILRDEYGHLPQREYLTVYYTVSVTGNDSLWSYRIYDRVVSLK